jgi:hypothetical protein
MIEAFVDESARPGHYLLACVTVHPGRVNATRSALRGMLLGGERRLHLVNESPQRRRALLSGVARLDVRASVYWTPGRSDSARPKLIEAMVADLVDRDVRRLVFESRAELDVFDRRLLGHLRRADVLPDSLLYDHMRPHEEPLLWAADAVAWAIGAGGDWRRRIAPIIDDVVDIDP